MSRLTEIRIAVVGQGAIGPRQTDAVLNVEGAALACIIDPHPPAITNAAKYKCPVFTSVEAMLEDRTIKVDAAIVCTPNHTHVTISKQLLRAGIHVLCEKPISVDVASGRDLVGDVFKPCELRTLLSCSGRMCASKRSQVTHWSSPSL